MKALSDEMKSKIVKLYMDGMSHKEIAEVLDISKSVVGKYANRYKNDKNIVTSNQGLRETIEKLEKENAALYKLVETLENRVYMYKEIIDILKSKTISSRSI